VAQLTIAARWRYLWYVIRHPLQGGARGSGGTREPAGLSTAVGASGVAKECRQGAAGHRTHRLGREALVGRPRRCVLAQKTAFPASSAAAAARLRRLPCASWVSRAPLVFMIPGYTPHSPLDRLAALPATPFKAPAHPAGRREESPACLVFMTPVFLLLPLLPLAALPVFGTPLADPP
jgi:hypothetical protein